MTGEPEGAQNSSRNAIPRARAVIVPVLTRCNAPAPGRALRAGAPAGPGPRHELGGAGPSREVNGSGAARPPGSQVRRGGARCR